MGVQALLGGAAARRVAGAPLPPGRLAALARQRPAWPLQRCGTLGGASILLREPRLLPIRWLPQLDSVRFFGWLIAAGAKGSCCTPGLAPAARSTAAPGPACRPPRSPLLTAAPALNTRPPPRGL